MAQDAIMAHEDFAPGAPDRGQLRLPLMMPPPEADAPRHIVLGPRIVRYLLVRSRRRTLAMSVDQRGLRVGAPAAARMRDIEDFIRSNAKWVLSKLDAWQSASRERRIAVRDGAQMPLFGEPWTLRVAPGRGESRWSDGTRELELRPGPHVEARHMLLGELRRRALDLFRQRATDLIRPLGRPLPPLALSNAQTRWGSCSSRSGLRFNWRLIHLPLRLTDYVVAHELGHLLEMNHSPRFWRVVEGLCPGYREAREELRSRALTMPDF
jgi:hypothetical protein